MQDKLVEELSTKSRFIALQVFNELKSFVLFVMQSKAKMSGNIEKRFSGIEW